MLESADIILESVQRFIPVKVKDQNNSSDKNKCKYKNIETPELGPEFRR